MAEGNGNWVWKVITAIMIPAFFMLTSAVVANDKDSRARDEKTTEQLTKTVVEQKDINKDILLALREIQVDLRYLKNGR